MRVLACGWRDWPSTNTRPIRFILSTIFVHVGLPFVLIEGQCRGVDKIAGEWAEQMRKHGVEHEMYRADWSRYRKGAGPIRNRQMLREGKPDLVVAFHPYLMDSVGTKDMVEIADAAGVETWLYDGRSLGPAMDQSRLF